MEFNKTSYFKQNLRIEAASYQGTRFDKKAFVFPGQGSSVPGMFKMEIKKHPEFQELFAIADQFAQSKGLGKVSDYINQHEAIEKKNLPFIRNMALFTSQVALFKYLKRIKVQPEILTAHSFGEYAVLTCSGALDFLPMLEIVYQRDFFSPGMNEAGSLIALSANIEDFKKLSVPCEYTIANLNSSQQIVLAVNQKELKTLSEFLKKNRIAARPMESVGRPYHSKWMQPAKDGFSKWLASKSLELKVIETPLLSSVNRKVYNKGHQFTQEEFKSLLTEQLTQPVLFTEQSEALAKMGIHSFIELGLTTVCVGFIKTNLDQHEVTGLSASHFLSSSSERKRTKNRFTFDAKNNKYFKLVSRYIGDITGYDINDITVGDNFQEDLQIDSIKKAEIVFRVLEESRMTIGEGISISQLHEVGDVVEYLEKIANAQHTAVAKKAAQDFRILTREWILAPAPMTPAISLSDAQIIPVSLSVNQKLPISSIVEKLHAGSGKDQKVLVLQIKDAPANFQSTPWIGELLKDFAELMERSPLTSQEFKVLLYAKEDSPFFRGLMAFMKCLLKESKKFTFKAILDEENKDLKKLIEEEISDVQTPNVKFKDGKRWTIHFKEVTNDKPLKEAVIFSIGGTKGILKAVYERFPSEHKCHLVIMARSDAKNPAVVDALKKLKKRFKSVSYHQGDASNRESLNAAVKAAHTTHGRIDVFVNSAGREVSKALPEQRMTEVLEQLDSKYQSLENLLSLKNNYPQAQFINFSSVVAHFGNDGQTVYAFANAYLDCFKGCRHIKWPPMDGIGMTDNPGILQKLRSMGASLMNEKQASDLFGQCLNLNSGIEDIFFLDLKDLYLYEYNLRNMLTDRKVQGDLADPTRMAFAKSYDLKNDSYLRDHHIESTSVVAAATGIAAFAMMGNHYFKTMPTLENFEIKNMILVNDRENFCFFQPQFLSSQEMDMKLLSQVEHFGGKVVLDKKPAQPTTMPAFKASHTVEMDSFYSVRSIDYGPKFQVMDSAFHDSEKNVVCIGKSSAPYLTGVALNDYVSYLIELSFQAIYLKNVLLGKGLGIPLRIRKIKPVDFYLADKIHVVPSSYNEGTDERLIFGGAEIYDGHGRQIMSIEGVEMSTIRLYEAPPFDLKPATWEFRGI